MGFKIKKKSTFSLGAANQKRNLMTRIAKLLDADEFVEAYPLIEDAVRKYPNEERFWEMLAYAGSEFQNPAILQRAMVKLTHFQPKEPDNWFNLALSYGMSGCPALALRTFSEFVRRFPDEYRKTEALEILEKAENDVGEMLEAYGLPNDKEGLNIAVMHDKVQLFMHNGEYDKSIEAARELMKKAPEFISPYNNLSLVYFMKGDVEKAVESAELALEKQPDNFHALSNSVRFLAFLGKQDEAQKLANRLRVVENPFPESYLKKIEAFAFLGDDEAVTEVYKEVEKNDIETHDEGYAKSLAAFSFYKIGDEKKAEELWKQAADDDYEAAEDNLEELKLPAYDRDVYALSLNYWLPTAYSKEIMEMTASVLNDEDYDKNLKKKISEFFDKHPNIIEVFPMILERGDFMAKDFVIQLAEWSEDPRCLEIVKEFALGKNGSDEIRNHAAMILSKLKAVPKTVRLWLEGEWKEIRLLDFFITGEASEYKQYPLKPKAQKLLEKAIEATYENNLGLAKQHYEKALEIQPDNPVLLNNLLAIRQNTEKESDIATEIRNLHARHPEYFFAAMSAALVELRDGNIDEAKKIADKFNEKEEWHVSEFKMWSRLHIELCLEQELYDGARSWLEMMKNGTSAYDNETDEAEYKKLEKRIEETESLKNLTKDVGKILERINKKKSKKAKGKSKK